jgi:hypothetical protein
VRSRWLWQVTQYWLSVFCASLGEVGAAASGAAV